MHGRDAVRGGGRAILDHLIERRRYMLVASAESRWAIFRYVEAAAFFDAGNVAARPADLNLNKTSWGGGLRLHVRRSTLGRVDVGHSAEGWHVFFKLDDPFA